MNLVKKNILVTIDNTKPYFTSIVGLCDSPLTFDTGNKQHWHCITSRTSKMDVGCIECLSTTVEALYAYK